MIKQYTYHTDPGHGWVEVELDELCLFGLENKISHYSYQNGSKVFLEEDCDAALFLNALKDFDEVYELVHIHKEVTPIRNYASYGQN